MKTEKTRIEFDWEGKHYVLEYTADSIKKMEKRGFDISKIDERLLSLAETLFCGAFIANHDDVNEIKRREIFKELSASDEDGHGIEDAIAEMFREAVEEMQSHRGNVKWRMTR
jgi:hypothetical protein